MSDKIRIALIGCGRIARRHAEHISEKARLVAACDIVKEKADALATEFGAKAYYSVESLLADAANIDVVSICSPNGLHAQHSILSLQAGCHVLCEKPLALSSSDCFDMIRIAAESKRQLFVIKQNRFNPPVQAVKKVIEEGRLGRIYSIQLNCFWNRGADYYKNSWKGSLDLDGGTLFTQFSHFIDLLYWMVGDVKEVKAFTGNYAHKGIIEFEDSGVVILEFNNGAIGSINYTVNSHKTNMEGSLTVFAEKGTVKIGGQYLNELEYQSIEGYTIKDLPKSNTANHYGNYQGSMSNHDKVYENLVDSLKNNSAFSTSSLDGLKTVEIIEKIYKVARKIKT